ncbi:MAG: hypothetical protein NXI16_01960 [Alphaproteobacteria bacterium]|nr:hypothetical protein [Alphaproteobacteria bacterium]
MTDGVVTSEFMLRREVAQLKTENEKLRAELADYANRMELMAAATRDFGRSISMAIKQTG